MDQVWERIERLRGRTLYTPDREPFQIVSVERSKAPAIKIMTNFQHPEQSEARVIGRNEIEKTYNVRMKVDDLTPTIIQVSGASVKNPDYIAAIFQAIEAEE